MGHADAMCISYVGGDARVMSVFYWFRTRYSEYRIRISLRCIDSNGVEGASYMFIETPIVVVINMLLVLLDAVRANQAQGLVFTEAFCGIGLTPNYH